MKNSILMLFLTFSFCFIACDKDDVGLGESNNLVGTWNVTEIQANSDLTGNVDAVVSGIIKFNSNGTGQQDYTWTALGITKNRSNSFSWVSTSSTITFDPGGDDVTVWTREINTTEDQRGTYTTIEDGQLITVTITLSK